MATYFLHVKVFSRAKGSRATKAAAYRAGERFKDERTGDSYNFSHRSDIAYKEIVLPDGEAERPEMRWALDRAVLWNAAEFAGRHRNSRVAREVLVTLPPELPAAERVTLVRGFARELSNKYGNAVDVAVHEPRAGSDERHHHAHLLMTMRQVTPQGMGGRTTLELSGTERRERGLGPSREDLLWMRERWAVVTNEAFAAAGLTDRVDHRSYRRQGLDREPQPMLPPSILYAEKLSGRPTPAGEEIRARYRERVAARAKGADELARVVARQKAEGRERLLAQAQAKAARPTALARGALTKEELKQKGREYYHAHRADIIRKQRERRHAKAAEAKRVAGTAAKERSVETAPVAARGHAAPAAAQDAVTKWLAYRERQAATPAPSAVEQWRAYRERDASAEGGTGGRTTEARPAEAGHGRDPAPDGRGGRGGKNDASL